LNFEFPSTTPFFGGVGGKFEIRNFMMTGSSDEPNRNVIPTEAKG
jgi:hypothetical protein